MAGSFRWLSDRPVPNIISVHSSILRSFYSVHGAFFSNLNPTSIISEVASLQHPLESATDPLSCYLSPDSSSLHISTCLLHRKVSESRNGIFQTPSTHYRRRGTSRLGPLSTTAVREHGQVFLSLNNSSRTHRASGMTHNRARRGGRRYTMADFSQQSRHTYYPISVLPEKGFSSSSSSLS